MKNTFGKGREDRANIDFIDCFSRQFSDANPNSIESSYYERTVSATHTYGSDHIDGDHHIYSLFYGISNTAGSSSRE